MGKQVTVNLGRNDVPEIDVEETLNMLFKVKDSLVSVLNNAASNIQEATSKLPTNQNNLQTTIPTNFDSRLVSSNFETSTREILSGTIPDKTTMSSINFEDVLSTENINPRPKDDTFLELTDATTYYSNPLSETFPDWTTKSYTKLENDSLGDNSNS